MRILITGDRDWTYGRGIRSVLESMQSASGLPFEMITIVHGDARGADKLAGYHAALLGFKVEPYPAEWKRFGLGAGPKRNQKMLESGVNFCLAFHDRIHESKGTRDMVTRCIRKGVPTSLYGHDRRGLFTLISSWNW